MYFISTFQSFQRQSNHPIPQLPLPHQQQLQASNAALLTQSHPNNPQPQRSPVNVDPNQGINVENPMLSINTDNTDQLAQQRHANRIFHAADSTHGKHQSHAQRLPSESSFGIQAPMSVVSTHFTTQSQRNFPPKHSNIERTAPRSSTHNQNHNSMLSSNVNANISNTNDPNSSINVDNRDHRINKQVVYGTSSFGNPVKVDSLSN